MDTSSIAGKALASGQRYLRKNGPSLLTGIGVAGFAATCYLAGKAALKAQEPVKELKVELQEVASRDVDESYTIIDRRKEAGRVVLRYSVKILKIYAPPIAAGVFSAVCIISAHGMMKNRQASLAAAYVALNEGLKAYRRRVAEEFGTEKETQIWRGPVRKIQSVDPETGLPCEIDDSEDRIPSPYHRWYARDTSLQWETIPEMNLFTLKGLQGMANDRLHARGFLFLNEVYDSLGLKWSQAGQSVGWELGGNGDGFVSFGIMDIDTMEYKNFIDGNTDGAILLDFNVDGPIVIE